MNLTCYIVDDEPPAIRIMEDFIRKTPGLELAGSSVKALEALEKIASIRPDLTFLDVDMPELNGLQIAGMVNTQTTVVFTTAYREYAPEAFEKEAADYLLKPISYERFLVCIQKIRKRNGAGLPPSPPLPTFFFVKSGIKEKLLRINIQDIMFISGFDHYVEIGLRDQKIVTYLKLSEALGKLPPEQFSQIHKSHIVNHTFIRSLEPGQVKLQDQTVLPIGRAYKAAFMEKMSGALMNT